jgi:purine-nucleoside phosphorylase
VLGSGLGGLVNEIETLHALPYTSIPNFPVSTVKGHGGKLILGMLGGKKVIALQGRFHFYEGYTMQEVTFPIRVFQALGIKKLLLSNAAGGMNPKFQVGDIVFINDHINLMPSNPLIGKNHDELGPRFPDMSEPYDPHMIAVAKQIADKHQFRSHIGIYAAVSGPCFETPAEYRYIRTIGSDLVGMSTVPEVIAARHGGTPCFAVSIVTDLGGFETAQKVSHEEVLEVATAAEKKLTTIIREMLAQL